MKIISDVDEVLTTTRTVRLRLDLEREVERDVLEECLRLAQQCTMGSNVEEWRVIAVYDENQRRAIAELYRDTYQVMVARPLAANDDAVRARLDPSEREGGDRQRSQRRVMEGVKFLADHLEQVPVLTFFATMTPPPPAPIGKLASGFYGTIFPFAWSFQLALRSRGIGSVMATAALHHERELRELLALPETMSLVAMIPVAYTRGLDFRPATRLPVDAILRYDQWSDRDD